MDNKAVTMAQAVQMFKDGHAVVLAEYRSSEASVLEWRDRQSGRAMSAPVLKHVVEFGPKSVQVSERVPDTFNTTNYVSPIKKGERCLVSIFSMDVTKGAISVRGTLTPVVG